MEAKEARYPVVDIVKKAKELYLDPEGFRSHITVKEIGGIPGESKTNDIEITFHRPDGIVTRFTTNKDEFEKCKYTQKAMDDKDPITAIDPFALHYMQKCMMDAQKALDAKPSKKHEKIKDAKSRTIEDIKYSEKYFNNGDFTPGIMRALLGKKCKVNMRHLWALTQEFKQPDTLPDDEYRVFHISTASRRLQHSLQLKASAIQDLLEKAMRIGLIQCVNDAWVKGSRPGEGMSKGYVFSKTAVKEFPNLIAEMGIDVTNARDTDPLSHGKQLLDAIKTKKIIPTGKCTDEQFQTLLRKAHIGTDNHIDGNIYSDDDIRRAILMNTPGVGKCIELAIKINERLEDKLKIIADIHIHRSDKNIVTKIGFRPSTKYASLPKERIKKDGTINAITKGDFMREHFGGDNYEEHDIKSSVPRHIYAFNHDGEWLDESIDMYSLTNPFEEEYAKEFGTRDHSKALSLRLNFTATAKEAAYKARRKGLTQKIDNILGEGAIALGMEGMRQQRNNKQGNSPGTIIFVEEAERMLTRYSKQKATALIVYDAIYANSIAKRTVEPARVTDVQDVGSLAPAGAKALTRERSIKATTIKAITYKWGTYTGETIWYHVKQNFQERPTLSAGFQNRNVFNGFDMAESSSKRRFMSAFPRAGPLMDEIKFKGRRKRCRRESNFPWILKKEPLSVDMGS